jgi:hypothetical protein
MQTTPATPLTISGGSGTGTIVAAGAANNTWDLTGTNAGTLNGTTSFSGIENLTGGAGNDTFAMMTATKPEQQSAG